MKPPWQEDGTLTAAPNPGPAKDITPPRLLPGQATKMETIPDMPLAPLPSAGQGCVTQETQAITVPQELNQPKPQVILPAGELKPA